MAAAAIVSLSFLLAMYWQAGAGVVGMPSGTSVTAAGAASPSDSSTTNPMSSTRGPSSTAAPSGSPSLGSRPPAGRFGLGLLIADRGNDRLLIVDDAKRILWTFPIRGSLPKGQRFSADDAFLSPDGRTIVANDEAHQVIDRIDIATRRVIWQYGHYGQAGSAAGYMHTPDDAYPLANGAITVADIRNCRILEISPAKRIVRHWGVAGSCRHRPPSTFDNPNGDTPLADGGLLITEIGGSRIVRLSRTGRVVFDIHAPVRYPSDAQLDSSGNVLVADYSNPGAILRISPRGHVLWRYGPRTGPGRLDHPSLAITLADGTIALNDDFRARVIVIDPRTNRIVWQYGRTDVSGRGPGRLLEPDGIDLIPVGTLLT
jgi:outer membrane protein assembly factor BamB